MFAGSAAVKKAQDAVGLPSWGAPVSPLREEQGEQRNGLIPDSVQISTSWPIRKFSVMWTGPFLSRQDSESQSIDLPRREGDGMGHIVLSCRKFCFAVCATVSGYCQHINMHCTA